MHWNLAGQVDRYGIRTEALAFVPIFLVVFSVIFGFIGLIAASRLGSNTIRALNIISAAVAGLMVVVHIGLLSANTQSVPNSLPLIMPGLLVVLGFAIKGVEPNPFVGIRVSWTMNNPSVWRKTHDRASKLWLVGGVISLALGLIGAPIAIPIGIFIFCVLYPLLDSYLISKSQS